VNIFNLNNKFWFLYVHQFNLTVWFVFHTAKLGKINEINKLFINKSVLMNLLEENILRIKEMMGIERVSNVSEYEEIEEKSKEGEIEEQEEGEIEEQEESGGSETSSASSSPSMNKWETGINRGKANPIDQTSKWETGINRGKGNPVW
jgi:hypothetical protein